MEQSNEVSEVMVGRADTKKDRPVRLTSRLNEPNVSLQAEGGCPTCGTLDNHSPRSYVYALGRVDARFPRLAVEKEFAQATGREKTSGLTDRQALHAVLSQRAN